jgi:hypothetical protein
LPGLNKGISAGIRTGKDAIDTARSDLETGSDHCPAALGKVAGLFENLLAGGDALTAEEYKAEGAARGEAAAAAQEKIDCVRFKRDGDYREFVRHRGEQQLERERQLRERRGHIVNMLAEEAEAA